MSDPSEKAVAGSTPAPAGGRRALLDVVLVVLATNTFQIGTGILGALVPFRLAAESGAAALPGFITSAYSVGFLIGCIIAPAVIARWRAAQVMGAAAFVAASMSLLLWVVWPGLAWAPLRFMSGFASGHLLTVMEAWIADRAPPHRRGATFSAYMVLSRTVFGLGQVSLALADTNGLLLFALASVAFLASPLVASTVSVPPPPIGSKKLSSLLDVPRFAPLAAVGAVVHAATTVSSVSLLPVWGFGQGLTVERLASMLVAIQVGAIVFQIPLGLLSDRIDRRLVMVLVCSLASVSSLVGPLVPRLSPAPSVLLVGAWGGIAFVLYSLVIAHMNDIARPEQRVAWSGSLLVIWGVGSTAGPMAAALLMDLFGAQSLFGFIAVMNAAFAMLVALNLRKPVA